MSQELVPYSNTEVGMPLPPDMSGLGGLDDIVKLKPANLTIVQNTTRDSMGAHAGQILDTSDGKAFDSIDLVLLDAVKQRVLFPPASEGFDNDPICKSDDGKVPSAYAQVKQAAQCDRCPHAQWKIGPNGKKIRPPCQQKLRFLTLMKDRMYPAYVGFGGTSYQSAAEFLTRIVRDIKENAVKGVSLGIYDYVWTLKSEKVVSKAGVYFVARLEAIRRVKTIGEYAEYYVEAQNAKNRVQEEDQAASKEAGLDAATGVVDAQFVQEV